MPHTGQEDYDDRVPAQDLHTAHGLSAPGLRDRARAAAHPEPAGFRCYHPRDREAARHATFTVAEIAASHPELYGNGCMGSCWTIRVFNTFFDHSSQSDPQVQDRPDDPTECVGGGWRVAQPTEVSWTTCEQAGCIGIQLAEGRMCLAHANPESRPRRSFYWGRWVRSTSAAYP
jgi:hypothetical protein